MANELIQIDPLPQKKDKTLIIDQEVPESLRAHDPRSWSSCFCLKSR